MTTISDKYKIIGLLGEGGMCKVYTAQQLLFDRVVAIKILRPELARLEANRRRFIREARNCARLVHPNILTIYETDEFEHKPFISMQYVEGGNLRRLIDRGCPIDLGVRVLKQVAAALVCAHENGVLHRDLKPANILVPLEGYVKVADWGLSKALDESISETKTITQDGIVLGTPQYMSPEQISEQEMTAQSDLYSFGVIFYELVTGHVPFDSEEMSEVVQAHLHNSPKPVRHLAPHVSKVCSDLIHACLAKDPRCRPASAKAVLEEIESMQAMSRGWLVQHEKEARRKSVEYDTLAMKTIMQDVRDKNDTPARDTGKLTKHKKSDTDKIIDEALAASDNDPDHPLGPPPEKRRHVLLFLLLCVLLAAAFADFDSEKATSAPGAASMHSGAVKPLIITGVSLISPRRVAIYYRGEPRLQKQRSEGASGAGDGTGKLVCFNAVRICVRDTKGEWKEGTLDFSTSRPDHKGRMVATHDLRHPLYTSARVELSGPALRHEMSFDLEPLKVMENELSALKSLKEKRLATLLNKINLTRVEFAKEFDKERKQETIRKYQGKLDDIFETAGIDRNILDSLSLWIPSKPEPALLYSSSIRGLLLPLRYAETMMSSENHIKCPWNDVTSSIGFRYTAEKTNPPARYKVIVTTHFVPGKPDNPTWLADEQFIQTLEGESKSIANLTMQHINGRRAHSFTSVNDLCTEAMATLSTNSQSWTKRPNELLLQFIISKSDREYGIEAVINGAAPVVLLNTSDKFINWYNTKTIGPIRYYSLIFPLPIDALKTGDNIVICRPRTVPGFKWVGAVALKAITLFGSWE